MATGEFIALDQSSALMAKGWGNPVYRGFLVKSFGYKEIGEKDAHDNGDLEKPQWREWKYVLAWPNKSDRLEREG